MATRIGIDKLYYATLTTDNATLVYGTPVALPGVMSLNITPNSSSATLFADDGPMETAATLGEIDVEIQRSGLSSAEIAALLGAQIDTKGAIVSGGSDTPPYVAIGFRALKSNGKYRYVWLYKGKFQEPTLEHTTKGDSIEFQSETIVGKFVKTTKTFTINAKQVQPWRAMMDEDDADPDIPTAIAAWFTAVYQPV